MMEGENLIDKYIKRIKIDYPEDDKLMIDLQGFLRESQSKEIERLEEDSRDWKDAAEELLEENTKLKARVKELEKVTMEDLMLYYSKPETKHIFNDKVILVLDTFLNLQ